MAAATSKPLKKYLQNLGQQITADPRTLSLIGELLVSSSQASIQTGGRYKDAGSFEGGSKKFAALKPLSAKFKKSQGKSPEKVLLNTGRLRTSITYEVKGKKLFVGSNVVYAAIHQFGGKIRVTPKSRAFFKFKAANAKKPAEKEFWLGLAANRRGFTMPARPFITIQDHDLEDIREIVLNRLPAVASL